MNIRHLAVLCPILLGTSAPATAWMDAVGHVESIRVVQVNPSEVRIVVVLAEYHGKTFTLVNRPDNNRIVHEMMTALLGDAKANHYQVTLGYYATDLAATRQTFVRMVVERK